MAKSKGFEYRGRDRKVEDVVRRSKQSSGSYDNVTLPDFAKYKAKEGEQQIRILPPTWEDVEKWGNAWEVVIWVHNRVGPDEGSYLCLDKMKGEKCPICEARRLTNDEDEADAWKPQWKALAWIVDRDNEKAGPQLWFIPITLFREVNNRSMDKKTGKLLLLDDPEEGYDLIFTREGADKRTKYVGVEVDRDATPIHDNEKTQQRWLDYIQEHPIPDCLQFFDAEYIEKVLFGRAGGGDEEGTRARRRRGASKDADEEEETPRRSARRGRDNEEEEEEKPRGRRGRSSDDDEEEEKPRGRRSRAADEDEEEEKPRGRRSSEEEAEEDEDRPRARRGRAPPEEDEEADEKPRGRRSRSSDDDDDGDGEGDSDPPRTRRGRSKDEEEDEDKDEERPTRRRLSKKDDDDDGDGDDDGDEDATATAKRSLGRLRNRRSK